MNLQFRAAQPGDVTAAVSLIYSSGPAAVAVINPRAQALHGRLGFVVTHERKSTLPNVAHHHRMEQSL